MSKAEIETSFGTIFARVTDSKEYPGISLCLRRPGRLFEEFCLLEVDEQERLLKAYVWNPNSDEPAHRERITLEEIKKLFGEE